MTELSIIIPTLNEEENLNNLFERIKNLKTDL
jgi:glycosyltransferase involved in cell wall biosynthesis